MTNKVAARDLFYTQGSPSYGDLKLKKLMKKIVFSSFKLVYGKWVFQMQQRKVPFSAGANGE